jgi:glycine dehydrogenase
MKVVPIACDVMGNVDPDDLKTKAEKHSSELAALMVTYPSTHGVFEEQIKEICAVVHTHGGQVYMDGGEYERAGRTLPSRRYRSRCLSLKPAQNLLYPSWRWWTWDGTTGVMPHLVPFLPGHCVISTG